MMEIVLDRNAIRLPRLADSDDVALPEPLIAAHARLSGLATDAAARAKQIATDPRVSESERQTQLTNLCGEVVPEINKLSEVVAAVESAAAESEASALRKAVAEFDPNRLLSIADRVAQRPRESRLNSYLRARSDRELAAALLSAPGEFNLLNNIDARVCDALRDQLIDGVDSRLRSQIDATRFATARARAALEIATAHVRKVTRTEAPIRERLQRVGGGSCYGAEISDRSKRIRRAARGCARDVLRERR